MPGFITTTRNHTAIRKAPDNHRFPDELAVHQSLHRYEKGVEIEMDYGVWSGKHVGLWIADCGLRIADFGFLILDF
jgi:hypothetical protein